jgi:hypothetical protein
MKTYTRIVAISFAVASRNGLVVAAQQDAERTGVSHPLLRGDQGGIDGELSAALENSGRGLQSCSQSGGTCSMPPFRKDEMPHMIIVILVPSFSDPQMVNACATCACSLFCFSKNQRLLL